MSEQSLEAYHFQMVIVKFVKPQNEIAWQRDNGDGIDRILGIFTNVFVRLFNKVNFCFHPDNI